MIQIVTPYIAVVADNQNRIFALGVSFGAGCVDTRGKSMVFISLLNVSIILLYFLFFLSLFIESVTVFGLQRMWKLV